ncbi:hypothetical protein P4114_12115 [Pseudomonas aeruginosa]|nr:hypothetical protein [Pseudomonas aeruginosa]
MPEQAVTLEALYAAIEQVLRERSPEAQLIGFWPGVPENTPAVSLEIAELLPERDPGTGESALLCRLQARIMVPPGADRQAVSIACGIVRTLRERDLEPVSAAGALRTLGRRRQSRGS